MIVENVGFNVKKLLGYDRCDVKFHHASMFMPGFFVDIHEKMVNRALQTNQFNLYIFNKNIILKNSDQYYQPARLELKLVYNMDGELKMEGYIQLQTNSYLVNNSSLAHSSTYHSNYNYYNWSNYFIVSKQDEQIMEVSPSLRQIIDLKPRKFVHCGDFFENSKNAQGDNSLSNASNRSHIDVQTPNPPKIRGSIRTCSNIPTNRKYLFSNGIQYQYIMYRTLHLHD